MLHYRHDLQEFRACCDERESEKQMGCQKPTNDLGSTSSPRPQTVVRGFSEVENYNKPAEDREFHTIALSEISPHLGRAATHASPLDGHADFRIKPATLEPRCAGVQA